ncbi:MAG: sulfotransferase family 2 domain-containing protein [Woeseiaceae bacterium]
MIISHRHKYIFFAVPKTATHTIREALRQNMGPDDWEQQVLFGAQSLPIPEIAALQHGHITANEIRPHLDAEIWQSYFKFGFVRNPFDRFISVCFFLNRSDPNFAATAVAFMKDRLTRKRFQQRVLVRPQNLQLCGNDSEIALDFVGRYEDLQQSFDTICEKIGVPGIELGRKNTSKHARYLDYYQDDELRQLVAEFYAKDLRLFSYELADS